MRELELPDSISNLVDHLQIVQLTWQSIPIQLPKFAVYSIINRPVFDEYFYRNGRKMALLKLGRYQIPVIDPFRGDIHHSPENVVVICHAKGNRFGLYAYPADTVESSIRLPLTHHSVKHIIKDFV